ncbi:MAG TPA: S53 family peptidase [Streptosporangiaceae bacterium]
MALHPVWPALSRTSPAIKVLTRIIPNGTRRARCAAISVTAAAGLLISWAAVPGAQAATSPQQTGPAARVRHIPIFSNLPAPISNADCLAQIGEGCYTPLQLRTAYDLNALYSKGITGRGRTIVISVPFGSPTIRQDMKVFDAQWGFPDPNLKIIKFGHIPPYDPNDFTRIEWALGTTLQAEYAHAMAPGAKIVIAETPVSETAGAHGFPELMQAQQTLINEGIGDVITQITGTAENTFPGFSHGNYASLLNLRYAFKDAAVHRVTELASSGDLGPISVDRAGDFYTHQVVSWPASDPLVTAVGGSMLSLDDAGNRVQPDTAWNETPEAGGGGMSAVFGRPLYQLRVGNVVGDHRGLPDITMSAQINGSVWGYESFGGLGGSGWDLFNGTAEATPEFAGIVALADQQAGHRLGLINPALYLLGELSRHSASRHSASRHSASRHRAGWTGLQDITTGNTSVDGVTGFAAGPGYDLATGWGTIDAATFVPALARVG